jgi:hypothetical protein
MSWPLGGHEHNADAVRGRDVAAPDVELAPLPPTRTSPACRI